MPTVFENSMVAHVWAQGRQREGRSHNGNFHFSGPALYSYAQIIALLLPAWKRGETGRVALLNGDSYSVTTPSHMTDARRALPPDVRPHTVSASFLESVYRSPDYMPSDSDVKREMDSRFREAWSLLDKASRARVNFSWLLKEASYEAAAAQELAGLYSVRKATPVNLLRAIKAESKADLKPLLEKQFAAERRERARIEAERRAAARARSIKQERTRLRLGIAQIRNPADGWQAKPRGPVGVMLAPDYESNAAWRAYTQWAALRALEGKETLAPSLRDAFKARAAALESQFVPAYVAAVKSDNRRSLKRMVENMRDRDSDTRVAPDYWARHRACLLDALGREHSLSMIENTALVEPVTFRLAAEGLTRGFQEAAAALIEAARAGEIARREEAEREAREKAAAQFAEWLNGESVSCPAAYRETLEGGVYMRRRGDSLETSKGARVPWAHALRTFRALKAVRERGQPWTPNGRILRVGHFQVDRIESDGSFKAACHVFNWPEIADIARRENVFDVEADESAFESRQAVHA